MIKGEKRNMKKISIKTFCKEYNNRATDSLKKQYIKDNLEITAYVPFITKDALINNLLNLTMIDKKSGNVKVNSSAEYLLMTRILIENYTNLTVETDGFYEEYDELKKSGLFNILLVGSDATDTAPLIPYEEIVEFKHLLSIKKADYMANYSTPQAFISNQIERITTISSATLKPVFDKIANELANMDDAKIEKIIKVLDKGLKRVK